MTLAELVVALGLLSMLLIGSITLFTSLLAANRKTNTALTGLAFANGKLEEIAESGNFAATTGSRGTYVMDANLGTRFFYEVQTQPLSGDTSGSSPYLGGYLVTLDVWWNVDSATRTVANEGLRKVRVRRFFYPQTVVP